MNQKKPMQDFINNNHFELDNYLTYLLQHHRIHDSKKRELVKL